MFHLFLSIEHLICGLEAEWNFNVKGPVEWLETLYAQEIEAEDVDDKGKGEEKDDDPTDDAAFNI